MRRGLTAAVLIVSASILFIIVRKSPARRPDPTRVGPERTLKITSLTHEASHLQCVCATNLPSVTSLTLSVAVRGETIAVLTATVLNDTATFDARRGAATSGSYDVTVNFALEEQSAEVRSMLQHQPRALMTRSLLVIKDDFGATSDLRAKLLELIRDTNRDINVPARRADLLMRLEDFEQRLWISTLVPAVRRLRLALEMAPADVAKARTLIVEAEVLATS